MAIKENNPAGQASESEVLTGDRTLSIDDHGKVLFADAVDLTVTLHTPTALEGGFRCQVVVSAPSGGTGLTVAGAINGGSTSAVNTGATDAQGDRIDLFWTATEWVASFHGTWSVT